MRTLKIENSNVVIGDKKISRDIKVLFERLGVNAGKNLTLTFNNTDDAKNTVFIEVENYKVECDYDSEQVIVKGDNIIVDNDKQQQFEKGIIIPFSKIRNTECDKKKKYESIEIGTQDYFYSIVVS